MICLYQCVFAFNQFIILIDYDWEFPQKIATFLSVINKYGHCSFESKKNEVEYSIFALIEEQHEF